MRARTSSWLIAVGLAGGCGPGEGGELPDDPIDSVDPDVPRCAAPAPGPHDAALFSALTAHAWITPCPGGDALPPTCTSLELRADGTYRWFAESDYVERDAEGRWNFAAASESTAMIFLDDDVRGAIGAALTAEGLRFDPVGTLTAGRTLPSGGPRSALTTDPPPLYCALTDGPWSKANGFDAFYQPDTLTFAPDGSYAATYRDGTCADVGTWSVYGGEADATLIQHNSGACDIREPGSTGRVGPVTLEDATLLLQLSQPFVRGVPGPQQRLEIDEGRFRLSGQLSEALVAGRATTMEARLINVLDTHAIPLGVATVTLQPLELAGNGFAAVGEPQVLDRQDFSGTVLEQEQSILWTAELIPAAPATWASLRFEVGGPSGYRFNQTVIVPVAPR